MYKDKPEDTRPLGRASQKRIWLANLLSLGAGVSVSLVGAHATASQPGSLPQQQRSAEAGGVRSNPFAEKEVSPNSSVQPANKVGSNILQTSDLQFSELRLRSIGTAVGLVPIGGKKPDRTPLEISKPYESRVRLNPMANRDNGGLDFPVVGLIEEQIVDASEMIRESIAESAATEQPASRRTQRTKPQIVRYEPTLVDEVESVQLLPPADTNAVPADDATEETLAKSKPTTNRILQSPDVKAESNQSLGVSFSMSDFSFDSDIDEVAEVEPEAEDVVLEEQPEPALMIPPPTEIASSLIPIPERVTTSEPLDDSGLQTAEVDSLPVLPRPHTPWIAKHSDTDVSSQEVRRYPGRHRAHVDVAMPPMISHLPWQGSPDFVPQKPVEKVRSARIIPAQLAGFLSEKEASEPEEAEAEDQSSSRIDKTPSKLETLVTKIRSDFPNSRVAIRESNESVLVIGVCKDRTEATEIIRVVRGQFLVPVDDQLVIR